MPGDEFISQIILLTSSVNSTTGEFGALVIESEDIDIGSVSDVGVDEIGVKLAGEQ